jgi:succinyl-CoA synthetase beta subunit
VDLLEHQGKKIFAAFGVPVPEGKAVKSVKSAEKAAEKLGLPVVVKAQVRVGGRGKAGGVKLAKTAAEVTEHSTAILGMDIKGHKVRELLIEKAGDIREEYYLSFMLDRGAKKYLGMCSVKGGMDIEAVAEEQPDYLAKVHIDPLVGLQPSHVRALLFGGKIPAENHKSVGALISKLYECFLSTDADLVEVNPLVIMADGSAVALDAKVTLDENAAFRQYWIEKFKDLKALPKQERKAKEAGLGNFVSLDGKVGIIGNGAGLTMSTLDVVAEAGGTPANFLDIGGGANAEVMANALEVILAERRVKSIMVNIFGGITRCDEVAKGVLGAIDKLGDLRVPVVVRLDGTNAEQGRKILRDAAHPKVVPAQTMLEAAERAVALAGGKKK